MSAPENLLPVFSSFVCGMMSLSALDDWTIGIPFGFDLFSAVFFAVITWFLASFFARFRRAGSPKDRIIS